MSFFRYFALQHLQLALPGFQLCRGPHDQPEYHLCQLSVYLLTRRLLPLGVIALEQATIHKLDFHVLGDDDIFGADSGGLAVDCYQILQDLIDGLEGVDYFLLVVGAVSLPDKVVQRSLVKLKLHSESTGVLAGCGSARHRHAFFDFEDVQEMRMRYIGQGADLPLLLGTDLLELSVDYLAASAGVLVDEFFPVGAHDLEVLHLFG